MVTGGTRGIGAALCELLVEAGAEVFTCGVSDDVAERAPEGVTAHRCDVSSASDVASFAAAVGSPVHLLVNNAGLLGPREAIEDVDVDQWRQVFAVNSDGPFLVTKALLDALREGEGVVMNVSSSVGRKGRGGWGPYACSKHALEGLTDTLADELGDDGISVISVNPGGTATDMRADAFPDEDPETLPTAREVAEVMLKMAMRRENGARLNVRDELP